TEALNLLLEAASDSAPDKRQAALDSAIKLFRKTNGQLARSNEVKTAVIKSLNDPSTAMRTMAAQACAPMNLSDAIPPLSKLALAGEISLARAALDSLTELAAAGEKEKVVAALTEAARAERNGAKSKRILDFVESKLK
ncbi:MAG TPA: HEAT repeat domain-containing protein, partial [Candidatus Obscuribacter sp.]|nr:HEAT repeat domain-containing protein [Candidatus Obscuribacter sp.]